MHSNKMKRDIFALWNKQILQSAKWEDSVKKEHLYEYKVINSEEPVITYEKLYLNNIQSIYEVIKRFQQNMNIREELMKQIEKEIEENQNPHLIVFSPFFSIFCVHSHIFFLVPLCLLAALLLNIYYLYVILFALWTFKRFFG